MLQRNGKALSPPHDVWPVLALGAHLLRCRDNAAAKPRNTASRNSSKSNTSAWAASTGIPGCWGDEGSREPLSPTLPLGFRPSQENFGSARSPFLDPGGDFKEVRSKEVCGFYRRAQRRVEFRFSTGWR
jgi:hypothetical protein